LTDLLWRGGVVKESSSRQGRNTGQCPRVKAWLVFISVIRQEPERKQFPRTLGRILFSNLELLVPFLQDAVFVAAERHLDQVLPDFGCYVKRGFHAQWFENALLAEGHVRFPVVLSLIFTYQYSSIVFLVSLSTMNVAISIFQPYTPRYIGLRSLDPGSASILTIRPRFEGQWNAG